MAANNIEVELRGPLSQSEYETLMLACERESGQVQRENRFLIDYSTFLEGIGTRKLDVRARITNGVPEIVVKKGAFGGASREEAAAKLKSDSIVDATRVLALMGYTRGVACDRGIHRFSIRGIEFAIQDVRTFGGAEKLHSRFYEAEILATEATAQDAEKKIRDTLSELGLRVFDEQGWNEYVALMNNEANGVFDISKMSPDSLSHLGQPPQND